LNKELRTAENGCSFFFIVARQEQHILMLKKEVNNLNILNKTTYLRETKQRGLNFCSRIQNNSPFLVVQIYSVRSIKRETFIYLRKKIIYWKIVVFLSRSVNYV
jgi:hypothetical protein